MWFYVVLVLVSGLRLAGLIVGWFFWCLNCCLWLVGFLVFAFWIWWYVFAGYLVAVARICLCAAGWFRFWFPCVRWCGVHKVLVISWVYVDCGVFGICWCVVVAMSFFVLTCCLWFGLICSLLLLVFGYVVGGGFPGFVLRVVAVCFSVGFCWVSGWSGWGGCWVVCVVLGLAV